MRVFRRRWPVIILSVVVPLGGVDRHGATSEQAAALPSTARTVYERLSRCDPAEALGRSDPVMDPAALARLVGLNVAAIAAPLMYSQVAGSCSPGWKPVSIRRRLLAITGIGSDAASAQTTANSFTHTDRHLAIQDGGNNQSATCPATMETLAESGAKSAEIEALHKQLRALAVERPPRSAEEFERREPILRPLAAGIATAATETAWVPESTGSQCSRPPCSVCLDPVALVLERFDTRLRSTERRGGVRDARPRRGPHDPCRASGGRGDGDTSVFARGERVPPRPGRDGSMDRCGARRDHDPGHERRGS
jgi:hypothetical protein